MKKFQVGYGDLLTMEGIKTTFRKFKNEITNNEEVMFRLKTSLKMTTIPIFSFLILGMLLNIMMKMDVYFFQANSVAGIAGFSEIFYDYFFDKLSHFVPYIAALIIFVNILALYISDIMLRPFRNIGDYCEQKLSKKEDKDFSYDTDFFTDLRLLTRFADFFFSIIESRKDDQKLDPVEIPTAFTKVHKPIFESSFFIHYGLSIAISFLAVTATIYAFCLSLNDGIISLAQKTLPYNEKINFFLEQQSTILDDIILIVLASHIVLYIILALNLYSRVSIPAFGIFSTMRAFLKGNHDARVHLIGHTYVRPQCRKLNKYLDHLQTKYSKK
jgi:hypothetical protein